MELLTQNMPFISFGTDGIRGITSDQLTPQFVLELGKSSARFFKQNFNCKDIIVGKDTRASCDMLDAALAAGMMQEGVNVVSVGVLPTPGIACIAKQRKSPAAVISASHNPAEHNGIKFFSAEGFKISEEQEKSIESLIRENSPPKQGEFGRYSHDVTGRMEYKRFLKQTMDCDLEGLKIGLDCSNGATYHIAPDVFADLGAEVHVIGDKPDGTNINLGCGSTHVKRLSDLVVDKDLDFGLAFDGDGDRIIAINEEGDEVDGDFIIAILAKHMLKEGSLKSNSVVVTVMTNLGFDIAMNKLGIKVHKCNVGDRHVINEMIKIGAELGGEQSGHIIVRDHGTTGDGVLTALQLARVIRKTEKPLTILSSVMKKAPQKLVNIKVANKAALRDSINIKQAVENSTAELGSKGRVLIRPSGTEPLIRVMVEAEAIGDVNKHSQILVDTICRELNGIVS